MNAELNTIKLIYNSDLGDAKSTAKAKFTVNLSEDSYMIVKGQVNCVFYRLDTLQWTQGQVAEKVEKDNTTEDLSGYTYFLLGTNNPAAQIKERLSSIGVTVVGDPVDTSGSVEVTILTDEYNGTSGAEAVDVIPASDSNPLVSSGTSGTGGEE